MDYVQQALERFRRQGPEDAAAKHRAGVSTSTVPPIVYHTTKTIEVADGLMRDRRLIAGFEGGTFVDAFKVLRTHVLHQFRQRNWSVLGVTSPSAGEGKTLTAVNLSLALAMDLAHTVLLVDADLRRPSVHQAFGLDQLPGLTEYLFDEAPLSQLFINPGIGRFVLLPGGRPITNSAEALGSPRMRVLVEELKHRYPARLVIFDLPPLLSRADALGFAPYVDALLLVAEEGRTRSTDVERALGIVKGTVPVIGSVLNKSGRASLSRRHIQDVFTVRAN